MAVFEVAKIQVRRGQEGTTGIPQLSPGEFAWAEDTQHLYIGKSIAEGAVDNNNTRVLTEHDLVSLIGGGSGGSAGSYRYRDVIPFTQLASTTTSAATKLDNWVSITDFAPSGIWPPVAGNDITAILQTAIGTHAHPKGVVVNNIPADSFDLAPRAIKIPAGYWFISTNAVQLPPYTTLIGEGSNRTFISLIGSIPMFQTVDGSGNTFDSGVNTGTNSIRLEGMTLRYAAGNTSNTPLVYLDNVTNTYINDVQLETSSVSSSTGIGIVFRSNTVTDITQSLLSDVVIERCNFNNLLTAIHQDQGTSNKITIRDNTFISVSSGVELWESLGVGPVNALIENNKFQQVTNYAVLLGTATNLINSYSITTNNTFRNIGTSTIIFNSLGNRSVDDFFDNQTALNTNYNYPIVAGNGVVEYHVPNYISVAPGVTNLINVGLTGKNQTVLFEYTLSNNSTFTRNGKLTMVITGDGYASVGDEYSYSELVPDSSNLVNFSTDLTNSPYRSGNKNYVILTCNNTDSNTYQFEYNFTILQ